MGPFSKESWPRVAASRDSEMLRQEKKRLSSLPFIHVDLIGLLLRLAGGESGLSATELRDTKSPAKLGASERPSRISCTKDVYHKSARGTNQRNRQILAEIWPCACSSTIESPRFPS